MEMEEKVARMQEIERRGLLDRLTPRQRAGWEEYKRRHNMSMQATPEQMSEDSTDWIDTANNTLRTIGGAVEAFDKGRHFGLGKRAGGLVNAIGSWPVDRAAELMGVENTPTFGDRYNEIVQGAKDMNREFADKHPVANVGLTVAGVLNSPVNKQAAELTSNVSSRFAGKGVKNYLTRTGAEVATEGTVGAGLGTAYGAGESDDIIDYFKSGDAVKDAKSGALWSIGGRLGLEGLKGAGVVGRNVLGFTTGTGNSVDNAFTAGKKGSKVFLDNMRGNVPQSEVVGFARNKIDEFRNIRNNDYLREMEKIGKTENVDLQSILDEFYRIKSEVGGGKYYLADNATKKFLSEAEQKIKAFANDNKRTVKDFDDLKQSIFDIYVKSDAKAAQRIQSKLYNSVKKSIQEQAPEYSKVMKDYQTASEQLKEFEKALSLGNKASPAQSIKKMQSALRNDARSGYGNGESILKKLDGSGELIDALSGQALNSVLPRGASGQLSGLLGLGGFFVNPSAALSAISTSPRVMGEINYGLGAVSRRLNSDKYLNPVYLSALISALQDKR